MGTVIVQPRLHSYRPSTIPLDGSLQTLKAIRIKSDRFGKSDRVVKQIHTNTSEELTASIIRAEQLTFLHNVSVASFLLDSSLRNHIDKAAVLGLMSPTGSSYVLVPAKLYPTRRHKAEYRVENWVPSTDAHLARLSHMQHISEVSRVPYRPLKCCLGHIVIEHSDGNIVPISNSRYIHVINSSGIQIKPRSGDFTSSFHNQVTI